MSLLTELKNAIFGGVDPSNLNTTTITVAIVAAAVLGFYIYLVYRLVSRKTFYSKNFNISLVALAMIVAAIILTIQSSVVISLGMVGALSIVRFRTAIKEPMDLVFLFWSISVGIICGSCFFKIAIVLSVLLTIVIIGLELLPSVQAPMLLLVDAGSGSVEKEVKEIVKKYSRFHQVKSRNLTTDGMDMVIELRVKGDGEALIQEINAMKGIRSVSLLAHDGE